MVNTALRDFAMQLVRPAIQMHPRRFGKGQVRVLAMPVEPASHLSDDLKLFAATFLAGFIFVSILIG
jgi:hypothetical protein